MTTLKTLKDYPIIEISLDEIKNDPSNPNVMTLEQSRGLEKSMMSFGRLKHIVIDQNNVLVDGEHRLEVEKAIGTERVNAIRVEVKDEVERKIIRETLNKLHGTYDKQKESSELLAIFENQRLDELADLLAQPKQELENLISRYNPDIHFEREEDESKLPSLYDTESFVKRGEIWQLGRHYLMCGDSNNDLPILLEEDKKSSLIITSPPYDNLRKYNVDGEYNFDFITLSTVLKDVLDSNGVLVWIVGDQTIDGDESGSSFKQALHFKELGLKLHDTMIYEKPGFLRPSNNRYHQIFEYMFILVKGDLTKFNPILDKANVTAGRLHKSNETARDYDGSLKPIGHDLIIKDFGMRGNIWTYGTGGLGASAENKIAHEHPAIFPVDLAKDHIISWSNENDIVLDPFLGSGSTLIACEQTNRVCYGMEIDQHYCSVIIKRWELYTNQKARKVN